MDEQEAKDWVVLSPPLDRDVARRAFRDHAQRLSALLAADGGALDFDTPLQGALKSIGVGDRTITLQASLSVLTDLARQRWSIRVSDSGSVEAKRPVGDLLDPGLEKLRIRAQEVVKRDEQLREPATQKFVKNMEKGHVYKGRYVSIYSLFRDGRELSDSLRAARSLPRVSREEALEAVIRPAIQFVDDTAVCAETGFRLQDIWRYFRHTWSNQYTSTPGRSLAFLVRDRARELHPVVGIGAIGSPIVQIKERDAWLGWHPDVFLDSVRESPSVEVGSWLNRIVDTGIRELYFEDLIEEQVLLPADVAAPTAAVLKRLIEYGSQQRVLHHRLVSAQDLKPAAVRDRRGSTEAHWRRRAQTHLYRSKRALSLADLLQSRMALQQHLSLEPTSEEVGDLLASSAGRRAVRRVLRKAKADRVGIAIADITVCGAVAPYGPILGGKLISMLAVSPEVVTAYRDKYLQQESEIASSMAGSPIIRPSQLVFLGTTSLYGVGSSQYNRLRMPAERIGGRPGERLAYLELGKSEAYGTSQFSSDTVDALVALLQQSSNGQRVNSIFGEGVSPKFRKIREGLEALSLPADALLQHGRQRIVYGVPIVRNLREFLLGLEVDPDYIFDMEDPARVTGEIARWWRERWLSRRIESDDVLRSVEQHTLVRPVRHGARVVLPSASEEQLMLFDDLD